MYSNKKSFRKPGDPRIEWRMWEQSAALQMYETPPFKWGGGK